MLTREEINVRYLSIGILLYGLPLNYRKVPVTNVGMLNYQGTEECVDSLLRGYCRAIRYIHVLSMDITM